MHLYSEKTPEESILNNLYLYIQICKYIYVYILIYIAKNGTTFFITLHDLFISIFSYVFFFIETENYNNDINSRKNWYIQIKLIKSLLHNRQLCFNYLKTNSELDQ